MFRVAFGIWSIAGGYGGTSMKTIEFLLITAELIALALGYHGLATWLALVGLMLRMIGDHD